MKLNEFIDTLERILKEPNHYEKSGWGKWNGKSWGFDCVCLIKAVLWGFNFDTTKPRGGGAKYGSNGVPDIGEGSMIQRCNNVSTDFKNISKGEAVWLNGHIGVYVGDGQVIEATASWNAWKVVKSQIKSDGSRYYKGVRNGRWEKHGFLPYIDYGTAPAPYFEEGKDYKLIVAKCIRRTPVFKAGNICKVKDIDKWTKQYLTSKSPNANAMLKVGFEVTPRKFVNENGRIWGSYGNCWVCLCNADGTKQCEKIN